MYDDSSFDQLNRLAGSVSAIMLFGALFASGNVRATETSAEQAKPTETEKQALVALEKFAGQFSINDHGAVVAGFLGGQKVTDAEVVHLAELKNLRILYLNKSEITDDGMKRLSGLTNLRKLYLGETAVGDAGLKNIVRLSKLEYLHLGDTSVSGAGTQYLKGLTNLKILHLFHTKVDDGGLANLKGLKNLQLVSLPSTTVTDEGVEKLQQAMPKLVIEGKPEWIVDHPDFAKELSVSIAVPARDSKRFIDVRATNSHFNVVVTNLSKRDLRLWETWNSWGYFNLSFDVLDDNDNIAYSIVKKTRAWTINGPTWVTVKPGEHLILEVDFSPDIWIRDTDLGDDKTMHLSFLALAGNQPEFNVRLRAVFRILPDWETVEHKVWTGTVRSMPDNFTIRHTSRVGKNGLNAIASMPRLTAAKAIDIAGVAMLEKFPGSFEKCKPYNAKLVEGIWHVFGTVPDGGPGGTPEALVRDKDGVVLRAFHGQ